MDGKGSMQTFFILTLFLLLIFIMPFPSQASDSMWSELLHPKQTVTITSKIPGGPVRVKCISSENDIKGAYLYSSSNRPFTFEVQLKFLTTIRYNCILTQKGREIGQFLGFRSGAYCEKGCTWEIYPHYALRMSSRHDLVNQTYKPIGSPDDHTYDYS